MFETDLHAHSLFSGCGLHSIIEMLTQARNQGLKAQAITDHGPFLGRKISSTFYERLTDPVEGIRLLKGMECNVLDADGKIDVIGRYMKWYDVVLLGLHNFPEKDAEPAYYADVIKKALEKNPCVDIIVHPNAPHFTMDFQAVAQTAVETDTVVELNNAKLSLGRSSEAQTLELIHACMESGSSVAVNSDAHALNEVGRHSDIEKLLKATGFPTEKIVNRSLESTLEWIASRRRRREMYY